MITQPNQPSKCYVIVLTCFSPLFDLILHYFIILLLLMSLHIILIRKLLAYAFS